MKKIKLTALSLAALLLWGCTAKPAPTQTTGTEAPSVSVPAETVPMTTPETTSAPAFSIAVDTPCGVLYLPDNWDLPIETQTVLGDPMVISFWAGEVKLYELTFSECPGDAIGMVVTEEGPVYVGLRVGALEGEEDMLHAMQESVNELLLQLDLSSIPEEIVDTEPKEDIRVETDCGILHFPAKWEGSLMTEQEEDLVDFYGVLPGRDPVLLFTVAFGTANGHLAAVITAEDGTQTDFAIVIHELELDESWTDGEKDTIYAMQEDMNYLLDAQGE